MTATATNVIASPSSGTEGIGQDIKITVNMSEDVTISGTPPSLILNDGGVATYDAAASTPSSMVFDYTVEGGEYAKNLTVLDVIGSSIFDSNGDPAEMSGAQGAALGLPINSSVTAYAYSDLTGISSNIPGAFPELGPVYVQTFDANLKALTPIPVQVSTTPIQNVDLSVNDDGSFEVFWTSVLALLPSALQLH